MIEVRQASLSRANTGLALFGAGREAEAQLIMEKAGHWQILAMPRGDVRVLQCSDKM